MSWLSELFGGGSSTQNVQKPDPVQLQNYYDLVEQTNPEYYALWGPQGDPTYAQKQAAKAAAAASSSAPVTSAPPPAPVGGGPTEALRKLNEAYGPDFESRYIPDTLDDPFVESAISGGRTKADQFITNMLKRGTLSDVAQGRAVAALDAQTPGIRSRLGGIGTSLIGGDRANLTNLANTQRGQAGQTPEGSEFDPTPLVNQLASTGQGYASSFGDRFNAALPAGDIYDTGAIGDISGAVTSPKNVSYDPYAVEGGKLKSGLEDTETPAPKKKRTTEVF